MSSNTTTASSSSGMGDLAAIGGKSLPSISAPTYSSGGSSSGTSYGSGSGGNSYNDSTLGTARNASPEEAAKLEAEIAARQAQAAAQQKAQVVPYQAHVTTPQFTFNPQQNQTYQALQQINQQLYQSNVALAQQLNSEYQTALAGARSQIEKMFQDQIGGVDPATQQALTQLENQVKQSQKQIVDFLNERGIAYSGITVEELGKLTGQANDRRTDIQATRVKDLQNQMINSLMSFAQQQLSGLSQNNTNQMNAFGQYAKSQQDTLQNSMNQSYQEYMSGLENQRQQEAAATAYTRQQEAAGKNFANQMELEKYQQGQQNYRANISNQPTAYQQWQMQQQQNPQTQATPYQSQITYIRQQNPGNNQPVVSYIQSLEANGVPENVIDYLLTVNGLPLGK